MKQAPLSLATAITLFVLFFSSSWAPSIKISPFPIFFAFLYHRYSLEKCLWISALSGFTIDLFSGDVRLGTHALSLGLTTLLIYKQKHHFFEDKPLALALFTFPISILWTALQWTLIPLSGISFTFSPLLILTDLIVMPLADTLYGYLFFCIPLLLYVHVKKAGWKGFFYQMQQKYPFLTKLLPKKIRLPSQVEVQS